MTLEEIKKEFDNITKASNIYAPDKQQEVLDHLWKHFVRKGIYPYFRGRKLKKNMKNMSVFLKRNISVFAFSFFARKEKIEIYDSFRLCSSGIVFRCLEEKIYFRISPHAYPGKPKDMLERYTIFLNSIDPSWDLKISEKKDERGRIVYYVGMEKEIKLKKIKNHFKKLNVENEFYEIVSKEDFIRYSENLINHYKKSQIANL